MSIKVLYNEVDQQCCAWLSNLMDAGHIRPGNILDKSISDLTPDDVRPYDLAHFFAGIAGWDYALTLAGWRFDGRVTWTGSCPCQPFSAAGRQRGSDDERHLWPALFDLIRECRPAIVFGEQVAGAAGLAWLDHVCADLENADYAAAAANLCAAGAGAPHIRQRLYWVAHADISGRFLGQCDGESKESGRQSSRGNDVDRRGKEGVMGHASGERLERHGPDRAARRWDGAAGSVAASGIPDPWAGHEWIECIDGKARPVECGIFPLANGLPAGMVRGSDRRMAPDATAEARVMRLRGYGNAIVPQLAAAFVLAAGR